MTGVPSAGSGWRLLVVNCNTSRAMTASITDVARSASAPGTTVTGIEPAWGPESAEGYFESYVTAAAVMDAVSTYRGEFDAVIMAGYGEHGREGMRQLLDVPVVDITEASAMLACLVSRRFGVITTLAQAIPGIEDSLSGIGLMSRCSGIRATSLPVTGIAEDPTHTFDALTAAGRELIAGGADSLVLGCAGFAGLDSELEAELGVPVFDSVASAVTLAESLLNLGKTTSAVGPFAAPSSGKAWRGWPVSPIPGGHQRAAQSTLLVE